MKYLKITLIAACLVVFSQSYGQDINPKVEKRFAKADTNNDKSISLEELTAFYVGKKTKSGDAFNASKVLKRKDANNDGLLSLEEFASKGKGKKKNKKKN